MKRRFLMPVLAVLALGSPALADENSGAVAPEASVQASPEATAEYAKFMKANFYLLEDQNFSKITCHVRAPIIEKALTGARQQFMNVPGNIEVDETLKDFSMTYDKGGDFSFSKPLFGFKANDPASVRDEQEFSEGTEKMKTQLRSMVDGVIDGIKGLFDEYTVTGQKKVLAFEKTPTGAVVTVASKGQVSKQTFANGARSSEVTGDGMTGGETSEFGSVGDKLLFTKSAGHIEQAGGNMDITVEAKYGKAGSVVFPTKILINTIMVLNGIKQDTPINIYLEGCTAE